jgi:hypothetical protein
MLRSIGHAVALLAACASLAYGGRSTAQESNAPFGGDADVAFAHELWKAMAAHADWPMQSDIYPGTSPHGKFLRVTYNLVHVDGKPYHLIIKDNFVGEDATQAKVAAHPARYQGPVTIMLQREPGYDPDDNDWFWVKYRPDGSIEKAENGLAMAGRVAKGSTKGCIACHAKAGGGDYVYSNDE